MRTLRRTWNLIRCNWWSFQVLSVKVLDPVVRPGGTVRFTIDMINDGLRLGCVYVVIRIASPYHTKTPVFDSHVDLEPSERRNYRIIDVPAGQSGSLATSWDVPPDIAPGIYYYQTEAWCVPRLLRDGKAIFRNIDHLFDRTRWKPAIEVVERIPVGPDSAATTFKTPSVLKAFISYSWDSEQHKQWVLSLADHLLRYGIDVILDNRDLVAGEEITAFIERSIRQCDVLLLVCTEAYTRKANNREGGVGMETVISSAQFLEARRSKKFIPIIRNNPLSAKDKLPTYLGSTLYVDMSGAEWMAEPFRDLLRGIQRESFPNADA